MVIFMKTNFSLWYFLFRKRMLKTLAMKNSCIKAFILKQPIYFTINPADDASQIFLVVLEVDVVHINN